MARVIAIDYGQRRTGIAVTDPQQLIAGALTTVATPTLYRFLTDYISKEAVERIVIGKPMQLNGLPSDNFPRVQQFVARWQATQVIPIEYYDERFTSVLAHQTMVTAGLSKHARRNKALVDEISATILLQDWLRRNGR